MITVYTIGGSTSCRKAIKWFKENRIPVSERRLTSGNPMTVTELKSLLGVTFNGFEDIFSYRSVKYGQLNFNIEECTVNEAIDLMIKNPAFLRKPIMVGEHKLVVGYDVEHIRCFLPGEQRAQQLKQYYLSEKNDLKMYL